MELTSKTVKLAIEKGFSIKNATQLQLEEYLKCEYKIKILVEFDKNHKKFGIFVKNDYLPIFSTIYGKTKEKAMEYALQETLKLV
jgi:hypothetical protein